jgi:hypothetical protein
VIEVDAAIGVVEIVNVALVAPAAMLTAVGTEATAGSLLASPITAPVAGAGTFKSSVAVEEAPALNVVGLKLSETSVAAGFTVSTADRISPKYVPEIVTVVGAVTDVVAIGNVALVAPRGMVTLPGTAATSGLLLGEGDLGAVRRCCRIQRNRSESSSASSHLAGIETQ